MLSRGRLASGFVPACRWSVLLALSLMMAVMLLPVSAHAGSLALVSCEGSTASEGWSAFSENAPEAIAVSTCTQEWVDGANEPSGFPPGMEVGLRNGTASYARAGLRFTAPYGEGIAGGDILVKPIGPIAPDFEGEPGMGLGVAQLAAGDLKDVFWSYVNGGVRAVAIPAGRYELFASVLCGGASGQSCFYQDLYVVGAHILLSSNARPSLSELSGSLTTGGALHGTQDASFTASDLEGPGIYQVTAMIDGNVVYQATPNLNGGACVSAGNYGAALEFYTAHPCPQSVAVSLPIHTGTLGNGIHELTVIATDAARNVSNVSQVLFRTENLITVAGAGRVPRGTSGSEPAYLVRFDGGTDALLRGVHRSYTDSALTLSGTLTTPQGAVAPDVPVHLFARDGNYPGGDGGGETVIASTSTDTAGDWSLTAPKGPSRTLRIGYGQASAASTPADDTVKESVSPTMRLRIRDQTGGQLTFSGQVSVSPLARPFPIVVIEASSDGHHWQSVGHQVRTNSQGVFHLFYSSAFSVGGRFAFRASTPETSLWLAGSTKARWLRVR